MREIKFRAWDEINNKMYQHAVVISSQDIGIGLGGVEYNEFDDSNYIYMQYTGLKDKNGKEIYEGDIVKRIDHFGRGGLFEILYKAPGFWLKDHSVIGSNPEVLEVIGNIYENPELLK